MEEVKKAVIPAAGLGTRFLPITKAMPKEMLPIIDKPVIHFVVEEAIASGIDDIVIITGRNKRAIEDYFDHAPELEMHLRAAGKADLLALIEDISDLADIHYIRQKEPKGLGDAVLKAERHIGGEPFAVLLGDDIVINKTPCTRQLMDVFLKYQCSVLAMEMIPDDKVSSYGIIEGKQVDDNLWLIENIIEKPKPDEVTSRFGAIGRYIFTPEIFDCLRKVIPGIGGELQLTDAIKSLLSIQKGYASYFSGKRYDTGDKRGYISTILDFSMHDKELRDMIIGYIEMN
jgi:UTP--glucose-1-phosphate uridylyltransferase